MRAIGKVVKFQDGKGEFTVEGERGVIWFNWKDLKSARIDEKSIVKDVELEVELEKNEKGFWRLGQIVKLLKATSQTAKHNVVFEPKTHTINIAHIVKKPSLDPQYANDKTINFNLKINKTQLFDPNKLSNPKFEIDKHSGKEFRKPNFDTQFIAKIRTQQLENARSLCKAINAFSLETDGRLAIGLGGASVYETSISLHHIYGFPFIPASALKGIAHHYALNHKKDNNLILEIFGEDHIENGKNNQRGKVIFFDAFPDEAHPLSIQADIMNPHYGDYYNGSKPPADYLSPVPIIFLTVAKNAQFQFVLGVKNADHLKLMIQAKEWLESALKGNGIGAKTAVGYGYMKS